MWVAAGHDKVTPMPMMDSASMDAAITEEETKPRGCHHLKTLCYTRKSGFGFDEFWQLS